MTKKQAMAKIRDDIVGQDIVYSGRPATVMEITVDNPGPTPNAIIRFHERTNGWRHETYGLGCYTIDAGRLLNYYLLTDRKKTVADLVMNPPRFFPNERVRVLSTPRGTRIGTHHTMEERVGKTVMLRGPSHGTEYCSKCGKYERTYYGDCGTWWEHNLQELPEGRKLNKVKHGGLPL